MAQPAARSCFFHEAARAHLLATGRKCPALETGGFGRGGKVARLLGAASKYRLRRSIFSKGVTLGAATILSLVKPQKKGDFYIE